MMDLLVNYPGMGSMWLSDGVILKAPTGEEWVEGTTLEKVYAPGLEGYYEEMLWNFPMTCVRIIAPEWV